MLIKPENYGAFNICVERIFGGKPSGVDSWHGWSLEELLALIPFSVENIDEINDLSDFVQFSDAFTVYFGSDHVAGFYSFLKEIRLFESVFIQWGEGRSLMIDRVVTAAKYPYALDSAIRGLMGEDMIFAFHCPYLAESKSDLVCSFLLLNCGFYKQSLQILRNVLEVAIAHAYFAVHEDDFYARLSAPDFRMPKFGGPAGMISDLIAIGVLDVDLASESRTLYSELSGAVHSEITLLNISRDRINHQMLDEWSTFIERVGGIVLKLVICMLRKGL